MTGEINTLHVQSPNAANALTKGLQDAIQEANATPAVSEAVKRRDDIGAEIERLEAGAAACGSAAKPLLESLRAASDAVLAEIIDKRADGKEPQVSKLISKESEARAVHDANARCQRQIIEETLPQLHVQQNRASAAVMLKIADELDRIAETRTARLGAMLKDVLDYEGALSVELWSGLSGRIKEQAAIFRQDATSIAGAADTAERKWHEQRQQVMGAMKG